MVDDDRFEVVDGQLKLKDGVSLDHETNPNLDVTVQLNDAANGPGIDDSHSLNIAVGDVGEVPSAFDDTDETLVNTTLVTGNVLSNDLYGDGITDISSFDVSSANGGTVTYNNDGTFTYTPAVDFLGDDTFTYTWTLTTNNGQDLGPEAAEHEWELRFAPMRLKRIGPSLVPTEVVVPADAHATPRPALELLPVLFQP